jgi:prepilin-type N-terminal cleavage/methylation domain-containing protein
MTKTIRAGRSGFTLVEIIVALVLIAIAASILATLISRSTTQANVPRQVLREAFALQAVMENVVARHEALDDLAALKDEIGDEGSAVDNDFGVYTVLDNHNVAFDADDQEEAVATNGLLKVSIQNQVGETISRLFTEAL